MTIDVKEPKKERKITVSSGLGGVIWFAGWMFTIAFAHLIWWQAILGLVIWPYYLGTVIH